MSDWIFMDWIQDLYNKLFPPEKKYIIAQDPDELGYWLEEVKDERI